MIETPGPFEMWMLAAQDCSVENLVGKRASFLGPRRIEGARPPFTVGIAPIGSAGSPNAVIRIGGVPKEIWLRHESLRTQASKLLGAREVVIGDPEFDSEFFIGGDSFTLHALFDAKTRALALWVFGHRPPVLPELLIRDDADVPGIRRGALVARFDDGGFPHVRFSPSDLLREALALADQLGDSQLEARLAATVRTDPVASVRLAAMAALRDERPHHPSTDEALLAACADPVPHVRLSAATAIGVAKGKGALIDLASHAGVPDDVSARAVRELRSHLPADRARSILSDALRSRRLATAAGCLDTLSRSGSHADVVARVLALEGGALGLAAAWALGRCGTAAEVELLREVQSRHPRNAPLAVACRSAVAAIYARVSGASRGQLSLAADDSGRLSVANEAGHLSLADGEPPRTSLGPPHGKSST